MSKSVEPQTSASPTTTDDVIGLARLLQHAKDNNIAYLIATLVAFQLGLLQKLWDYGSGVC
jgi:hypothetical protein